jgi:hypothetical protein
MVLVLLVTPSYKGQDIALNSTYKDGQAWRAFFISQGVPASNIVWLAEESLPGVTDTPTCFNIFRECHNLVARSNDPLFTQIPSVIFVYAGHGVQLPNYDGKEVDGKDECILSTDRQTILDDVLRDMLVDALPQNARLLCIFDCCHSKTMLDTTPIVEFDPVGHSLVLRERNQFFNTKPAGPIEVKGASKQVATRAKSRSSAGIVVALLAAAAAAVAMSSKQSKPSFSPVMLAPLALIPLLMSSSSSSKTVVEPSKFRPNPLRTNVTLSDTTARAQVLCLSACRDSQFAYETVQNGYFTRFATQYLASNPRATVKDILQHTGSRLVDQNLHQHPAASFVNPEAKDLPSLLATRLDQFWTAL